jgi:uroporphyrinogen-III synthase
VLPLADQNMTKLMVRRATAFAIAPGHGNMPATMPDEPGGMSRPLTGFTVGITGHRRWEEQAEMLGRRGAQVQHGPVMHTNLLHDADETVRATEQVLAAPVDHVVLTTAVGTRSWFAAADSAGLDVALVAACRRANVLARGPKARSAAIGAGLDVHWQAPGETSAELLARLAELGVAGTRVVVQRDGGEPVLADGVRTLGAEVVDVPVYRWQLPDDPAPAQRLIDAAIGGRLDAMTFTCAYGVGATFALADDPDALAAALDGPVRAVAVGPVTAAALRRHGVVNVVEPERARLGAMIQALVADLSRAHRILRLGPVEGRWQGAAVVHHDESVVTLTPGEARVLDVLLERAPAVVPKAELVDEGVDEHAAEAAIGRLRAKLGPLGPGIRVVRRRGYTCELAVEPAEAARRAVS